MRPIHSVEVSVSKFVSRFSLLVVLCLPLFSASAISRSWVGSVNNKFSEPNNWSPVGVPGSGDSLTFTTGGTLDNDLPAGTVVGPMTFTAQTVVTGNALTLMGDVTTPGVFFNLSTDLKIGKPLSLGSGLYYGSIDINGQTLTVGGDGLNSLNGIGTLIGSAAFVGSGTFTGTMSGGYYSFTNSSMPNANIVHQGTTWASVSGSGTVGSVEAGAISPGGTGPCCATPSDFGRLDTNSLYLSGGSGFPTSHFDLNPAGDSDFVHVTGTVTLNNPALSISMPNGFPTVGQTFLIIANDGTDAVNGTFAGLPEGSSIDTNGVTYTISYHGGDGNDVELTAAHVTKRWTAAVSHLWSNPANWSPAAVPAPGESLLFPIYDMSMVNDLPAGTVVGPMTFTAQTMLTGNALTLMGDVTPPQAFFNITTDLKIGTSLTLHGGTYSGATDVNGQTVNLDNGAFFNSLNGSGTLIGSAGFLGSGTFNGTMYGGSRYTFSNSSMPNANIMHQGGAWADVYGTGTIGSVEARSISPADVGTFGRLNTNSVYLGGPTAGPSTPSNFDLNPAGDPTDFLHVTGTVTLDNPVLKVSLPSGIPTVGQTFLIIANDGTDPVIGTFAGLPEGSSIETNGVTFTISYHGGDGNDVELTTAQVTKRWTAAVSHLWSNPANWSPAGVPAPGEPLLFPIYDMTMVNDLPAGTVVGPMTFRAQTMLTGNALTLMGDVTPPGVFFNISTDLKIGTPLTLGGFGLYFGSIDVNGQTLTIGHGVSVNSLNGTGTVIADLVEVTGSGNFSGQLQGGHLTFDGSSMPNVNITHQGTTWPEVTGTGTLGNVEAGSIWPGSGAACCGDPHNFGRIDTKSLLLNAAGPFQSSHFDLNPNGDSDFVHVTGTVTINNAALSIDVPSGVPSFGQSFLIIANDGTDPVAGTFGGLPEGASVQGTGYLFRITYKGGDGNDVELTKAEQPNIVAFQSSASSVTGENVTWSATVSSGLGTPAGTVTFFDDGVPLGTASLVGGTASLNAALVTMGSHTITAVYSGGGAFVGATAAPLTHFVVRGDTTTSFAALFTPLYGQTQIRTTTLPKAPADGVVTGSIVLVEGANAIATANVSGGSALFEAFGLKPGTHTLTATYEGSNAFNGSSSAAFKVTVDRAATQLEFTDDGSLLKITVQPFGTVSDIPTGTVTITENGNTVAQQPVVAGSASVTLTLGPGHHTLHVSYSGDDLFQGAAHDIDVDVEGGTSRHRAVRH